MPSFWEDKQQPNAHSSYALGLAPCCSFGQKRCWQSATTYGQLLQSRGQETSFKLHSIRDQRKNKKNTRQDEKKNKITKAHQQVTQCTYRALRENNKRKTIRRTRSRNSPSHCISVSCRCQELVSVFVFKCIFFTNSLHFSKGQKRKWFLLAQVLYTRIRRIITMENKWNSLVKRPTERSPRTIRLPRGGMNTHSDHFPEITFESQSLSIFFSLSLSIALSPRSSL